MNYENLLVDVSERIATVTFNRPKSLNALNPATVRELGAAMEELEIKPGSLTVITHDREDSTLEFISKGYVTASLINKTAMQAYLAIAYLELWYTKGFDKAPVSSDNKAANFDIMPQYVYTGTVTIDKTNVEYFKHNKMSKYDTKLYQ